MNAIVKRFLAKLALRVGISWVAVAIPLIAYNDYATGQYETFMEAVKALSSELFQRFKDGVL